MRPTLPLAAMLILALAAPPAEAQECFVSDIHVYVWGGSANLDSQAAGVSTRALGGVVVHDGNTADCDGDGVPLDFDGDWETGAGGGFLPFSHHGATVCLQDLASGEAPTFVTGIDGDGDGLILPDVESEDVIAGPFTGCGWAPGFVGCARLPLAGDPNLSGPGPDLPDPFGGPGAASHCASPMEILEDADGYWVFLQTASLGEDGSSVYFGLPATTGVMWTS